LAPRQSPSPPWGRGWLATGAFISRAEKGAPRSACCGGEGVRTVESHTNLTQGTHRGVNPLTPTTSRTWRPLRLAVPPLPRGGEGKCRNSSRRSQTAATAECENIYVALYRGHWRRDANTSLPQPQARGVHTSCGCPSHAPARAREGGKRKTISRKDAKPQSSQRATALVSLRLFVFVSAPG